MLHATRTDNWEWAVEMGISIWGHSLNDPFIHRDDKSQSSAHVAYGRGKSGRDLNGYSAIFVEVAKRIEEHLLSSRFDWLSFQISKFYTIWSMTTRLLNPYFIPKWLFRFFNFLCKILWTPIESWYVRCFRYNSN